MLPVMPPVCTLFMMTRPFRRSCRRLLFTASTTKNAINFSHFGSRQSQQNQKLVKLHHLNNNYYLKSARRLCTSVDSSNVSTVQTVVREVRIDSTTNSSISSSTRQSIACSVYRGSTIFPVGTRRLQWLHTYSACAWDMNVAGVTFYALSKQPELLERQPAACLVTLEAEPSNPHDPNAIRVLLDGDIHIGYVPRTLTDVARLHLDEPWVVVAMGESVEGTCATATTPLDDEGGSSSSGGNTTVASNSSSSSSNSSSRRPYARVQPASEMERTLVQMKSSVGDGGSGGGQKQ